MYLFLEELSDFAPWLCALGVMGSFIGKGFRNQMLAGFVLGFLLGPIGWGLVLGLPDRRAICPACRESIAVGATRCKHCKASFKPDPTH
jgi:hypothetical protein